MLGPWVRVPAGSLKSSPFGGFFVDYQCYFFFQLTLVYLSVYQRAEFLLFLLNYTYNNRRLQSYAKLKKYLSILFWLTSFGEI